MHILYLIDEIVMQGGTEKSLYKLVEGLAEKGVRVTVFALEDGPYAEVFRESSLITYKCFKCPRIYNPAMLKVAFDIISYIRREKVDLVQTIHTASDLIGPIIGKLAGWYIPIVSSRRDLGFTKKDRHIFFQKIINKLVTRILVNSESVKRSVVNRESYPGDWIDIIYNGIDLAPYKDIDRTYKRKEYLDKYQLSDDVIIVGAVGNLNKVKGHQYLVDAVADVSIKYEKVVLMIAGEGPERESLLAQAREKEIEQNLILLGNIDDVPGFLSILDIYVHPSLLEGFSNAILEAKASKVPIIATNVGGNPEMVRDGVDGLLVNPNDKKQISNGILSILSNDIIREKFILRGYQCVQERFVFNSMLSLYIKYYDRIILET